MSNVQKFLDVGQEYFEFLVKEYGFEKKKLKLDEVGKEVKFVEIYYHKANGQFVSLSLAPSRYELELRLGIESNTSMDEKEVGIGDYVKLFEPVLNHNFGWANSNPDELSKEIVYISELLKKYGKRFFENDNKLWNDVYRMRY